MTTACPACISEFSPTATNAGGVRRFCSSACAHMPMQKTCAGCGDAFYVVGSAGLKRRLCRRGCGMVGPGAVGRWKGGRNLVAWRKLVFAKCGNACGLCGASGFFMEAHHIVPRQTCPEKQYDVSNGIVLCRQCHGAQHARVFGPIDIVRNMQRQQGIRLHDGVRPKIPLIKTCRRCSQAFAVSTGNKYVRIYCSKKCKSGYTDETCPVCSKMFLRTPNRRKYCSKKCSEVGAQKRRFALCLRCSKRFEVLKSKTGKFCSNACKGAARANKTPAQYRAEFGGLKAEGS